MSTGFAAIPLLKAAPEPEQIADRLEGGPWRGIELCLGPQHVADDASLARAAQAAREGLGDRGLAVTAEAPVAWPSGAFVRVDRLDEEANAGVERSAEFAARIGSPVLTIHLFIPLSPDQFRASGAVDVDAVEEFLGFYADACIQRGVDPLIENVPPVLRMRTGGVYLSPIGGHWRDLLDWRERIPELGFTIDTSHAALFRSFATVYPGLFAHPWDEELELGRYVEELGPHAQVAHVSDAHGLLGEGLPYGAGELELDPVVRRLGELVRFIVAEINEPDPVRSVEMKRAYRAIERALALPPAQPQPARRRVPTASFDWQQVLERRDPVPSVLELQERFGGRRILLTGGGGSIGGALATFLGGFRPERITIVDGHESSLIADRRARDPQTLGLFNHVLCHIREPVRLERLRAAEAAGVVTVVVASTDKAALAQSFYGRTKRFMEQLTAFAARRAGAQRTAVRLVNVLGSAGAASEIFLSQAHAGVPLTVTDTGMVRYWITMPHAACLVAQAALLAGDGVPLC